LFVFINIPASVLEKNFEGCGRVPEIGDWRFVNGDLNFEIFERFERFEIGISFRGKTEWGVHKSMTAPAKSS
jgi:hypothetical protein